MTNVGYRTSNMPSRADEPLRRVSATDLESLKRNAPIAEVATRYGLRLIRSGPRFVSLCPFHDERHPSFTLFPEANRFWCFGCHQGGDVIELVRLLEGMSFREALNRLQDCTPPSRLHSTGGSGRCVSDSTDRAFSLPTARCADQMKQQVEHRSILLARQSAIGRQALEVATALYETQLTGSLAAQQYLRRRGLSATVAHRRRLGYCSGEGLVEALGQAHIPLQVAWDVGLIVGHRTGSQRERFAGRITIPEVRAGQPMWMTGRLVDDTVDAPRYLHLPGPRPLYGVEWIAGATSIVGVEGYFDALTLGDWGIPAFAVGGTALPPGAGEQMLNARIIYLAFDADPPGQAGALAVARVLGRTRTRLVTLPAGVKDVNDLGQRPDGKLLFLACLNLAHPQRVADDATRPPRQSRIMPALHAEAESPAETVETLHALPALARTPTGALPAPPRPALLHDLASACGSPSTSGHVQSHAARPAPQRHERDAHHDHHNSNQRREVA